jgi:hypothetical protein
VSKAVGVAGRSNHSPSTLASLSGALVVLVWREVACQSRFCHDKTGDQDFGHTLSKSGAGSEDRRGSGQYVSPWMMTAWSSLALEGDVGLSLQSFCAARARPPMPPTRYCSAASSTPTCPVPSPTKPTPFSATNRVRPT